MAKIPDPVQLAGNVPESQLSVFKGPENQIGAAMESAGNAGQKLGGTLLDLGNEDDALDAAKANANFLSKKINLESDLANDQDYPTVQERYNKGITQIQQESGSLIRNQKLRDKFNMATGVDIARGQADIKKQAFVLEGNSNIAYTNSMGEQLINQAINSKDPVVKARAAEAYSALVDGLQAKNFRDPTQGVEMKKKWQEDYAKADAYKRGDQGDIDGTIKDLEESRDNAARKAPPVVPGAGPLTIHDKTSDAGFGYKFGKLAQADGMIIHHTGGDGDVEGVISTFKDRNFPAQFVIARDGTVYQTLPDGARGQHMQNGSGKGAGLSNGNMEGVEIIAKDDKDVTQAQRVAAAELVAQRAQKWGYDPKTSVYGHGEVNPGHKEASEGMSVVNGIRDGEFDGVLNGQQTAAQDAKAKGVQVASNDPNMVPSMPDAGGAAAAPTDQPARKPNIYDNLSAKEREELIVHMRSLKDAAAVDQERKLRIEKQQAEIASDKRETDILQNVWSEKPTITAKDVVNDPTLTREAKERVTGIVNRDAAGEPPPQVSRQNAMNILADIRRPDNDPQKITDLSPIDDAYIKDGKLTRGDYQFLRKEVQDARTPEGSVLAKRKADFLQGFKPMIDKSNPMMGVIDKSGPANFYNFSLDVEKKIDEYRAAKKNPYDLFDPSKPDFMGNPKVISGYQKPLAESIQGIGASLNPPAGAGSALQQGSPPAADLAAQANEITGQQLITPSAEPKDYGLRPDGTPKGPGFLGELKMNDGSGKVATEISIGVEIDGKETLIPSIVPTLTKEELGSLLDGKKPSQAIVKKAADYARERIAAGKSPFADQPNEAPAAPVKVEMRKAGETIADYLKRTGRQ